MTIRIHKWGNKLGVNIPEKWLTEFGWQNGSEVELQPTSEGLLLKPIVPIITLNYLLEGMTEENQHESQLPDFISEEVW